MICPACDHLLQLPKPKEGHSHSEYNALSQKPSEEESSATIAFRPMTSADTISGEVPIERYWKTPTDLSRKKRRVHRKRRSRGAKPKWDSESASAKSGEASSMAMIVGGSLLCLVVVGLGAWLVLGTLDSRANNGSANSEASSLSMGGMGDVSSVDASVQLTDEEQQVRDEIQASVNTGMDVMVESEKVVRAFLTAESAEDLEGLVRTPELTVPRMREWYGRHKWAAPGATQVCVGGQVKVKGVMASMSVQLNDYSIKIIVLERTADGYLIDWESWVAWSEMDWTDLFKKRPTQSVEVRVLCQKDSYYNRLFSDEQKWLAVKMEYPEADRLLYGYIENNTTTLTSLVGDLRSGDVIPMTLKVRYPEGSVADNQVIIEDYVQKGWIIPSKSASIKNDPQKSEDSKLTPKRESPLSHE